MKPEVRRYLLLDAMRGVAALAVVWGHILASWNRPQIAGALYGLAVDFFFILSGFVVAHAYGERMKRDMSPLEFCTVRAIRLYPLLVVGAVLGVIAMFITYGGEPGYTPANILGSGLLAALGLPSYLIAVNALAFPINGPAWSLFFELAVNFVYGFIARFLTINRLAVITLLAAGAVAWFGVRNGDIGWGWQKFGMQEGVARVAYGFFAGVLLYQVRPKFTSKPWLGYLLLAALAVSLFEPVLVDVWWQLALAFLFLPALVWFGSSVSEDRFIGRAGAFLGAMSYPIYILHWPFVDVTRDLFRIVDPSDQWLPLWVAIQLAAAMALAWLALKLVDEPVRARLTQWFRRRRHALAKSASESHAPSG